MNQIETISLRNESPWEGVGVSISEARTPEEMLEKAGLNWKVNKIPLFGNVNGKIIQAEHYLLTRNDNGIVLDEVTESWQPCQNLEAFEIFNSLVENGDLKMEVAGSLKNGQIVWALAKIINKTIILFDGDYIDSYLLFSNPHVFGQIISVKFSPIRRVNCTSWALPLQHPDLSIARLTHRRKFDGESVKQMLKISSKQLQEYKKWAIILGKKKIDSSRKAEAFFKKIFPSGREKKLDLFHNDISLPAIKCMEIFETQPGAQFAPGSAWQLWNATAFYLDRVAGRSIDNRLKSSWFGDARKTKTRAAELAYNLSKDA